MHKKKKTKQKTADHKVGVNTEPNTREEESEHAKRVLVFFGGAVAVSWNQKKSQKTSCGEPENKKDVAGWLQGLKCYCSVFHVYTDRL